MNTQNRKNLYTLAFTLLVVMLGYGIIIPIIPFYMESMGAGGTELGLLVSAYAMMRLVCGPIWGSLSDRVGRKPILLIGLLGYTVTMFWFGLANQLWMLFAARILSGILSSATAPTTMAYIGDSTSSKERGGGMGILGAAGGIGTILGPSLGGLLAKDSLSTPFFVAGGLALASLILAAVILPESLPAAQRKPAAENGKLIDLRVWWRALFGPIGPALLLVFLSTSALMIFSAIFGLYGLDRFGYGPEEVGVIFMIVGVVSAAAQGGLAGPLTKRFGEPLLIKVSLVATALSFGLMLLANNLLTVTLSICFLALTTALQVPAIMSLTSQQADLSQGVAMGLSNSFVSLGRIAGPLLAGPLYDWQIWMPYAAGALIALLSALYAALRLKGHGAEVASG